MVDTTAVGYVPVDKAGDTMTGDLILNGDPTANLQAATKQYVDGGSGSGANTALSNLASVAINTSLVSDTDVTDSLGSLAIRWENLYVNRISSGGTATNQLTFSGYNSTALTYSNYIIITTGASPSCAFAGSITSATQAPLSNNTRIATCEYVDLAVTAGGGGTVTSVSGTTNRVSSTGGATPVIDIDAAYVGQTSITTLGTIATGVWSGTTIGVNKGGTGQTTNVAAINALVSGSALTTATVASADKVLIQDADDSDNLKTVTAQAIADLGGGGTVTSVSGTASRISSTGGATPVIDIDAAYVGQASITTLGTITTGVWNGTDIAVADGGTGSSTAGGARTNLGLDTMATQAASAVAITGGTIAGTTATTFTYTSGGIGTAVTCVTQAANNDSTLLASTAFVNQAVNETQTDTAANSVATFTLVEATSNYHKVTFTSNCTLAFTFTAGRVQSMCLQLINAGAYTVTLPTILWAGGTAPTFTAAGTDVIVVWHNGDNIVYGALIGQDMS